MKQWAINILLLILCVAAILIALLKVTPFEITADTYVGSIVTLLSIAVAFVIGFQIYNAIELKKELAENKANYNRILAANEEMEKKYHEQQNQMEEGFSILSAIINKNRGQSFIACGNAFKAMHHAFIFSLETDCANTESMFVFLRQYISDFNFQTFTSGYAQLPDGRIIINIVGENEGKTLREVVDNYLEPLVSLNIC